MSLRGGMDASLTAALAVEALGTDPAVGVTTPSTCRSTETGTDAALFAE
jgi:PP-loop superfamily ATP-utilizing enzyme